jgi:4-alpha-glucanotransferase
MSFPRSSGILLHPTSLPGPYGIGELWREAHRFADFLRDAGQRIWQVLPLGPTGYGDSPYQCFSAFAGNPLLISLDTLVERGYLDSRQLDSRPEFPAGEVDFGAVIAWKSPLLRHAFQSFQRSSPAEREEFAAFRERHSDWLDEFALFMALKEAHNNALWTRTAIWRCVIPMPSSAHATNCTTKWNAISSSSSNSSGSGAI